MLCQQMHNMYRNVIHTCSIMRSNRMDTAHLREKIGRDEFDYNALTCALNDYANVRSRISRLLRNKVIIRVKKGLYVFAEPYRRLPICRELLANLIYGPSYVSAEYALHYHGLIPERVETITSVSPGRARSFATPLGSFSYRSIPLQAFPHGMDSVQLDDGRSFLIATAEKALADKVALDRVEIRSVTRMRGYLFEDLRIEKSAVAGLNLERLREVLTCWPSQRLELLLTVAGGLHTGRSHQE